MLSFDTYPRSRMLSTVARVNARLGISGEDAKIAELLAAASYEAETFLGYGIVRAEVNEEFFGIGARWKDRVCDWAPLLAVTSASYAGQSVALSEFKIVNAEAAILRRTYGWTQSDEDMWSVTFWAGWLTPADDFETDDITYASTGSITLADGTWPLLLAGDRIAIGTAILTVASRVSDTEITVSDTLADSQVTSGVTVYCSNLPADIEQAVIERVQDLRSGSTSSSGGDVTREEIDGISVSYSSSSTGTTRVSTYDRALKSRARLQL